MEVAGKRKQHLNQPSLCRLALFLEPFGLELGELKLRGRQAVGEGPQAIPIAAIYVVPRSCRGR